MKKSADRIAAVLGI